MQFICSLVLVYVPLHTDEALCPILRLPHRGRNREPDIPPQQCSRYCAYMFGFGRPRHSVKSCRLQNLAIGAHLTEFEQVEVLIGIHSFFPRSVLNGISRPEPFSRMEPIAVLSFVANIVQLVDAAGNAFTICREIYVLGETIDDSRTTFISRQLLNANSDLVCIVSFSLLESNYLAFSRICRLG